MEQVRTIQGRLTSVGKWIGLLAVSIICSRFLDTTIDWFLEVIFDVFSKVSGSYTDAMYQSAAKIHSETVARINTLLIIVVLLFFLPIFLIANELLGMTGQSKMAARLLYVAIFTTGLVLPMVSGELYAEKIRSATLSQIDIIRPFSSDADLLHSKFLLVQSRQDFIELWNSVMVIANEQQVVLPAFSTLVDVEEDGQVRQ